MLCHSAMQAAYNGAERKVSYKTANKIAAQYHDSVKVTKREFFSRPLTIPAMGIALAAVLLLGFVYPKVWSDWVRHHTGGPIEQTVRPVKPVKQVKTIEQPGVEGHPQSSTKRKAAVPLSPPSGRIAGLACSRGGGTRSTQKRRDVPVSDSALKAHSSDCSCPWPR